MKRFYILSIILTLLNNVSIGQTVEWVQTCNGQVATTADTGIDGGGVSISNSNCGTCCDHYCFSGDEGAVRVVQSTNNTAEGLFVFPVLLDMGYKVDVSSIEVTMQRSGTGMEDYLIFVDGTQEVSGSRTGGSSTWTETITFSPVRAFTADFDIEVRSSNGSSPQTDAQCDFGGTFRVERVSVFGTTLLPVVLSRFELERLGKSQVELLWTTASEINNDYFEIEHSTTGGNFQPIGLVAGHGTTSVQQDYSFIANLDSGVSNYFRLKQVDYDGAYEYSDIRVINQADASQDVIHSYLDGSSLKIESKDFYSLSVIDANGSVLITQNVEPGKNTIDVSSLANGIYFVKLLSSSHNEVIKIVK